MKLTTPYEAGEFVTGLKQKDHAVFTALYDKYAPALYTLVLQIVRDEQTGKDVMRRVFTSIWQSIHDYDPSKQSLFIWMLHIARNMALEETGSRPSHHMKQPAAEATNYVQEMPLVEIDNSGLKKATIKLDTEQEGLFNLYYYRGFTVDQIAQKMALPADQVKTKIKTTLSELGNILGKTT